MYSHSHHVNSIFLLLLRRSLYKDEYRRLREYGVIISGEVHALCPNYRLNIFKVKKKEEEKRPPTTIIAQTTQFNNYFLEKKKKIAS